MVWGKVKLKKVLTNCKRSSILKEKGVQNEKIKNTSAWALRFLVRHFSYKLYFDWESATNGKN